ncbi:hypothetical protein QCA50_008000 [Cerrena zonata]|uniref:BZIP domain-containing protein n=1 Tax=Cerrena zonata TaxID=2478898 RepID=A0AAW0G7R8_9APHY
MSSPDDLAEEVAQMLPEPLPKMLEDLGGVESWDNLTKRRAKIQADRLQRKVEKLQEKRSRCQKEEKRGQRLEATEHCIAGAFYALPPANIPAITSPTAPLCQGLQCISLGRLTTQPYGIDNPFLTSDLPHNSNLFGR